MSMIGGYTNNRRGANPVAAVYGSLPLDAPKLADRKVCQFHFGFNHKRGPCTNTNCPNSHNRADFDNLKRKNPNIVKTLYKPPQNNQTPPAQRGRSETPRGGKGTPRNSRSPGGHRIPKGSRSPGGTYRAGGAPTSPRKGDGKGSGERGMSPSLPPTRDVCKFHLFHLVNGSSKCTRPDCKFLHPQKADEACTKWAKEHKRERPDRRHSPAGGSPRGSDRGSGGGKGKKKKKGKGGQ